MHWRRRQGTKKHAVNESISIISVSALTDKIIILTTHKQLLRNDVNLNSMLTASTGSISLLFGTNSSEVVCGGRHCLTVSKGTKLNHPIRTLNVNIYRSVCRLTSPFVNRFLIFSCFFFSIFITGTHRREGEDVIQSFDFCLFFFTRKLCASTFDSCSLFNLCLILNGFH